MRVERSRGCVHGDADSGSSTERLSPKAHFAAPILGEVLPARIHLLDQSNLLLPAPAFDLLLSPDGNFHVLVAFVIHQAMALVFPGEALDSVVFMLKNATREKTGDTCVKRASAAGENVDPKLVLEPVAHPAKGSTSSLERTPRIGMAADASSGSLHSPSVASLPQSRSR